MILGLDVSSSITGVSVVDNTGAIIYCEHIDTRNKNKFPTLLDKARHIKEGLQSVREQYNIESIFIEESLQTFRSGFSSAKTLSTLAKINGIVSEVVVSRRLSGILDTILKYRPSTLEKNGRRGKHSSHETS